MDSELNLLGAKKTASWHFPPPRSSCALPLSLEWSHEQRIDPLLWPLAGSGARRGGNHGPGYRMSPACAEQLREQSLPGWARWEPPGHPLPATEVRSMRRVVPRRCRRGRMAGVAKEPQVTEPAQAICRAHPIRSPVIYGRRGAPLCGVPLRPQDGWGKQAVAERKAKGRLGVPFRILSTATLRAILRHSVRLARISAGVPP
jgi:hypothetical protein